MMCDDAEVDAIVRAHRQVIVSALEADSEMAAASCSLALGGSYGRGEGGVWVAANGLKSPYNDYDLVLVHRHGAAKRAASWCRATSQRLSHSMGLHVDLTPLDEALIAGLPPTLTWFELGHGHQIWWGAEKILAPLAKRTLAEVHPTEWGRLLMNRSAGVVFAQWHLAGIRISLGAEEDPVAFATRQIEKAWLALGDAWLADRGLYHDRIKERLAVWRARRDTPGWAARWEEAAAFKLRPRMLAHEQIADELRRLAPLLIRELGQRPVSIPSPLADLARTMLRTPPTRWMARAPWRPLRERVPLALAAELDGCTQDRQRLCGTPEQLLKLWRSVA